MLFSFYLFQPIFCFSILYQTHLFFLRANLHNPSSTHVSVFPTPQSPKINPEVIVSSDSTVTRRLQKGLGLLLSILIDQVYSLQFARSSTDWMFATQLLRILQTLPPTQTYETCAFDAAELEAVMKGSPRGMWDLNSSEDVPALVESEKNSKSGFWGGPEVKSSKVVERIPDSNEGEIRSSDEGVLIESMRNLHTADDNQNDYRCSAVPCAIENETDHYTDKKVVDLELPELMAFYNDNANNDVKDICIDEGVPCTEKIFVGTGQENIVSDEGKGCGMTENDVQFVSDTTSKASLDNDKVVENGGFVSDASESSSDEDFDYKIGDSGQPLAPAEIGHATDNSTDNVSEERVEKTNLSSSQNVGIRSSLKSLLDTLDANGKEVEKQNVQIASSEAMSQNPSSTLTAEESNESKPAKSLSYNSKVESATITFDFNSSKAAAISPGPSPNDANHEKQPLETSEDYFPDNFDVSSEAPRHSQGESSFSMAGPVSGLITYSGQIAYSGSVSLRSDSSTTSTRSFAFPVLQNEWNSSPIRMAKADRRHYRRHRGWRHGLLCCRF